MKMKQNKQSKLVIALSAVILLLVALSATLTFAYFTAGKSSEDATVNFGHLKLDATNITIAEGLSADTKLVPGDSIAVKGSAKLTNNIDAIYRIKVTVTGEGVAADALADLTNSIFTAGGFDTTGAVENGGYYYGFAVADANTEILDFGTDGKITFDVDTYGNEWQDKSLTFKITVQAIQADHIVTNKTYDEVTSANVAEIASAAAWSVDMSTGK